MRTIVDIPDRHVEALDRLAEARRASRAALVREAVELYLETQAQAGRHVAFGGWEPEEDGLEIQNRLRGEWSDR